MKKFLILALLVASASCLTTDEYDDIYFQIFRQLFRLPSKASTVVRLSFHDCVGGCDGCININNDSNAGLDTAITIMENVYSTITAAGIVISRADLWAIGGRAAADYGRAGMPNHKDYDSTQDWRTVVQAWVSEFPTFQTGREDCNSTTAPYTDDVHEFPSAHDTFSDVFPYFRQEFGFSRTNTVAIMGAHTYGGMETTNSGYDGAWTTGVERNTFEGNVYYNMMIDTQFTYRSRSLADATGDEARPLYSATTSDGTQTGNFIVSDLAIVYNFGVEDDTRFADCEVTPDAPTCTQASTYSTVQAYAADNDLWLTDYYTAYDLMTSNGAGTLTDLVSA